MLAHQTIDYTKVIKDIFLLQNIYADILPMFKKQAQLYTMVGADEVPGSPAAYEMLIT